MHDCRAVPSNGTSNEQHVPRAEALTVSAHHRRHRQGPRDLGGLSVPRQTGDDRFDRRVDVRCLKVGDKGSFRPSAPQVVDDVQHAQRMLWCMVGALPRSLGDSERGEPDYSWSPEESPDGAEWVPFGDVLAQQEVGDFVSG
jgi:hypothetical protein